MALLCLPEYSNSRCVTMRFDPEKFTHLVIANFLMAWVISLLGFSHKTVCGLRTDTLPDLENPNQILCPRCVVHYLQHVGQMVNGRVTVKLPRNFMEAVQKWDGR
jgi:hypothetical protein